MELCEGSRNPDECLEFVGKGSGRFRMQSRLVFLTYPRCLASKDDLITASCFKGRKVKAILVAKELHKDGTPHLHAVVEFSKVLQTTDCRFFDFSVNDECYHGCYSSVRHLSHALRYCKKGGDYVQQGDFMDYSSQSEIQKRARRNKMLLEVPLDHLVDQGVIAIGQYDQFKRSVISYRLDSAESVPKIPRICIWIYGSTGIGKSLWVRDMFGDAIFTKSQNKWWDGYSDQKAVIIDDFDLSGNACGHNLKLWSDDYSFIAEVKGYTIRPCYNLLIITSQYSPNDIWCPGANEKEWDTELRDAIERRFLMCTISKGELIVYMENTRGNKWFSGLEECSAVSLSSLLIAKKEDFAKDVEMSEFKRKEKEMLNKLI